MKKTLICILLVLCLAIGLCACNENENPTPEVPTLAQPTNVVIDSNGVVTWDNVENATGYTVNIDGVAYNVNTNSFTAPDPTKSFNVTIVATADGYTSSVPSEQKTYHAPVTPKPPVTELTVAIDGASEIKSGKSATYVATVNGSDNQEVTWKIVEGKDFATITSDGVVTANEVSGDKTIVIRAQSKADVLSYAEKAIGIVARPTLTADMLDTLKNVEKMSFEGYMSIDVYSKGLASRLEQTYVSVVKTAMDSNGHWYSEYEDASTGINQGIYYANHNGVACEIGLNLMNAEQYYPLSDDNGADLSWINSGLYNNFDYLDVDDFVFDEETWRYVYKHSNTPMVKRMISSANPYDFDTPTFALIIEEGEILGITAKSNPDETLLSGYTCYEELFVAVNTKDTVVVPTIPTYEYDAEMHAPLNAAIQNMQALESYTLDYNEMSYYLVMSTYITEGYFETVSANDCYFIPYTATKDSEGNDVKFKKEGESYGYHKVSDTLYNSFFINPDLTSYYAGRSFAGDFDDAKPSFAFAPEIFRSVYEDEETGAITYYVEKLMSNVATTFYRGVGNDSSLYGIYATEGYTSTGAYLPYVTVEKIGDDYYITESGFYFYLGTIYGFITINYSDFGTASIANVLPAGVEEVSFDVRQAPTSWSQLTIAVSDDTTTLAEDEEIPANAYISEFFGATKTAVNSFDISTSGVITWDAVADTAFYLVSYTETAEIISSGATISTRRHEIVTEESFATGVASDKIKNIVISAYDADKSAEMPFFGDVLGDTFGFALTGMRLRSGENQMKPVLQIYYDVPLDLNYSIDSSIKAVEDYLVSLGFVRNSKGEYVKGKVVVLPMDVSLDFIIYVWYD